MTALETNFDLFSGVPEATQIIGGFYETVPSQSVLPITNENELLFFKMTNPITSNVLTYIDLSEVWLMLQFHVKKVAPSRAKKQAGGDPPPPPPPPSVSTVNNAVASLFSTLEISLNKRQFPNGLNPYGLEAWMHTLFNVSKNGRKNLLYSSMWYDDFKVQMPEHNPGYIERSAFIQDGQKVTLFAKIAHPLFRMNKFLLTGYEIELAFRPARAIMALQTLTANESYTFSIDAATLRVRKIIPAATTINSIEARLKKTPAVYRYSGMTYRQFRMPPGLLEKDWTVVENGKIPNRIFIMLQDQSVTSGTWHSNMFDFRKFNMKAISLELNGQPLYSSQPLKVDNVYSFGPIYAQQMRALGLNWQEGDEAPMKYQNWFEGQPAFILCFDLTSNEESAVTGVKYPSQTATLTVKMQFSVALEQVTVVQMFLQYNNQMLCHADRSVSFKEAM